MSSYSQIIVSFNCSSNDSVAGVARRHADELEQSKQSLECGECLLFLRNMAHRIRENPGSKGGVALWGAVGRSINADSFVGGLERFWSEILSSELDGGPTFSDRIIVFYEHEGSRQAHCYEIGFAEDDQYALSDFICENGRPPDPSLPGETMPKLEIKHHDLPFAWML